jgi:hypothetical protein
MSSHKFTNARVHEWLTPELDSAANAMHTTRIQLNSAALWWFCCRLSPEDRAEILGEFVKYQALGSNTHQVNPPKPKNLGGSLNGTSPRSRARRTERDMHTNGRENHVNGHNGQA